MACSKTRSPVRLECRGRHDVAMLIDVLGGNCDYRRATAQALEGSE